MGFSSTPEPRLCFDFQYMLITFGDMGYFVFVTDSSLVLSALLRFFFLSSFVLFSSEGNLGTERIHKLSDRQTEVLMGMFG